MTSEIKVTKDMPSRKLARALVLRDAALTVVNREGAWEVISGKKMLFARVGNLQILHRTPFQSLPPPSDQIKYLAAQHGLPLPKNLLYGLDVWASSKKVMNIEWDDNDNVELVSLRSGEWENALQLEGAAA